MSSEKLLLKLEDLLVENHSSLSLTQFESISARDVKNSISRRYETIVLKTSERDFVLFVEDDVLDLFDVLQEALENKTSDSWLVHATFERNYYIAKRESGGAVFVSVSFWENGEERQKEWKVEFKEYLLFWMQLVVTLNVVAKNVCEEMGQGDGVREL